MVKFEFQMIILTIVVAHDSVETEVPGAGSESGPAVETLCRPHDFSACNFSVEAATFWDSDRLMKKGTR